MSVRPSLPSLSNYFAVSIFDKMNIKHIKHFLSDEECDHIVGINENVLSGSKIYDDNVLKSIESKVISYLNYHIGDKNLLLTLEMLDIVKYDSKYDSKVDTYSQLDNEQKQYTFFIYTDIQTINNENLFVPEKGDALFCENKFYQNGRPMKEIKYKINVQAKIHSF